MDYRKFDDTYAVRIDRGEYVHESLLKLCEQEHILLSKAISIVTTGKYSISGRQVLFSDKEEL